MTKKREAFLVRHDQAAGVARLTDTMAGRLFKALMLFSTTGEICDVPIRIIDLYDDMRNVIIRDQEAYAETCERNRQYAMKRWHKEDAPPPPEETDECIGIPEDAEGCVGIPKDTEKCHPNPNPNPNPNPKPNPNPDPDPDPTPDPKPKPEGRSAAVPRTPEEPLEEIVASEETFAEQKDDKKGSCEPIKTEEIEYEFYGKERNVKLSKGEYLVLSTNYPNETRRHIDLLSRNLSKGKTIEGSHFDYIRDRIEAEARMKRNVKFA